MSAALTADELIAEIERIMSTEWPDYIVCEYERDSARNVGLKIAKIARKGMIPISRPPASVKLIKER